jgi:bifunctional DNA-binding transcriptional regulator/antitoxin component of YhaV-PrlF toxin-antitoxin module
MTINMDKDGSITIPLEARCGFGLENGGKLDLLVESNGFVLRARQDDDFKGEFYTPRRRAELLLNNAFTKEEWDEIVASLMEEGIDPKKIPSIDMSLRETLQTDAEWEAKIAKSRQEVTQQVA